MKPCFNCTKSTELDALIADFITRNSANMTYTSELKPLILRYSDGDKSTISALFTALDSISDGHKRLRCYVQLIKVNKLAQVSDLSATVLSHSSVDLGLTGKLILYSLLKMPKERELPTDEAKL